MTNKPPDLGDPLTLGYTRSYTWTIDQSVSTTAMDRLSSLVAIHYRIPVSETGFDDSNWHLAGEIKFTNPNLFPLRGVTITDTVDDGGTCVVPGGGNVTAPGGQSIMLTYACRWQNTPTSLHGVDTVTAAWNPSSNHTPGGRLQSRTPFAFTVPTATHNAVVTIVDTHSGVLGTLAATNTTPYASTSFADARTVHVPLSCVSDNNVATIAETLQSARKDATVCRSMEARPSVSSRHLAPRLHSSTRSRKLNRPAHTARPVPLPGVLPHLGGGGTASRGTGGNGGGSADTWWLLLLIGAAGIGLGRRLSRVPIG